MRVQSALVASEHAAQSQVGNLEFAPAADEEVGRLEISVDYFLSMDEIDTRC